MHSAKRYLVYAALILVLPLGMLMLPRGRPTPSVPVAPPDTQPTPSVTKPLPASRNPWTLAEAREALKRQPDDSYLQYVVLQLARQETQLPEIAADVPLFAARRENKPVPLFGIFNSAQALQLLQLETVLAAHDAPRPGPTVPLEKLAGPRFGDRPWKKLLAGKKSHVSPLARCVPEEFYLADFRSLERLVAVLDAGHDWTGFLGPQLSSDATEQPLRRRLQEQLVFEPGGAVQHLVDQVAITGSDLFLNEGSDLTLLLQLKAEAVEAFRERARRALAEASADPNAWQATGKHLDIEYAVVATPDRRISVYAATLKAERLHIRANSREALFRVIEATVGKSATGTPARRLADNDEHQYIRSLLPAGDNEEDGLIHLSAPHLRRVLGPEIQLTRARRLIAYNHLRMIAYAAQLYRTQFAKAPVSLDELTRTGCAPGEFNKGLLASPFGGTYKLSADGTAGMCSAPPNSSSLASSCLCCRRPLKKQPAIVNLSGNWPAKTSPGRRPWLCGCRQGLAMCGSSPFFYPARKMPPRPTSRDFSEAAPNRSIRYPCPGRQLPASTFG